MKADLTNGTSGIANQYNISFTVRGDYLAIEEFVYAIEKNPNLGFRIEEFTMVPFSEEQLQGTFIIKNISIDPNSLSSSVSVSTGTVTDNQKSGTNSGDTTNQTNTENQTNTTNQGS